MTREVPLIHPGEILREDFQKEMGFSAAALARALGVATPTVNNILRERGVSDFEQYRFDPAGGSLIPDLFVD